MKNINIISEIDRWAHETPDAICYEGQDNKYSYDELKRYSDSLAAYLAEEYDDRRPLIVYGGIEFDMLVCFLACVKSGHAYVPMDHSTPLERAERIAETADAPCILAIRECGLDKSRFRIIDKDVIVEKYKQGHRAPIEKNVKEDENFYIIFTSGTTGGPKAIPKGVQISHNNLSSFLMWISEDFQIGNGHNYLAQAPFSFDLSVMDICLMEPSFNEEVNRSITHFLFCGEELAEGTAQKLMERFPSRKIYNLYGPTEATVAITQILITEDMLNRYERLPIGYAKEDSGIIITDEDNIPVPDGEIGEIVITGPSVSKGYINNPAKTKEEFMILNGKHAYKTGDAGLYEDGILFFRGRLDFQVKLNGYRIELEDIDNYLMETALVKEAAVVPRYENNRVKHLVAFIVTDADRDDEFELTHRIKGDMKAFAMEYMIPKVFTYVDSLPLTLNGKIDRKRLMREVND